MRVVEPNTEIKMNRTYSLMLPLLALALVALGLACRNHGFDEALGLFCTVALGGCWRALSGRRLSTL